MSLLSWNEYSEETAGVAAAIPAPEMEPKPVSEKAPARHESLLDAARASLRQLEVAPGLEELDMNAGRVQVDDKRMINCRADLNQLAAPAKAETP